MQELEKSLTAERESKIAEKQVSEKKISIQEEEHKAKVLKYELQIKEIVSYCIIGLYRMHLFIL